MSKDIQINFDASERDLEYIKNFRLMDDDFMMKFFEENLECTEFVLRIIMNNPDLKVQSVHTQHEIRNLLGHSVRLDAYATDKNAKKYNIEIQRSDKGASPKRARYHSSIIDANILPKGEEILPIEVIELIQQCVDGENIYTPRKPANRQAWGTGTQIKQELRMRNQQIYKDYLAGSRIPELASRYNVLTFNRLQFRFKNIRRGELCFMTTPVYFA